MSDFAAPKIDPVPGNVIRPTWSVMIPTYECARFLRQTLESVLAQDPGPELMQIEVIDDHSTRDDPRAVVEDVGKGRVAFYRKESNEGAVANFNTCVQRSRGHLVHILHGDDFVLPGFYEQIGKAAERYPTFAFFASRDFFVNEDNVILSVTPRLQELEAGSQTVDRFYYGTPVQTPGVVVRRSFYEQYGGFLPALIHTADVEMWARAISLAGGVVLKDVLACYRYFSANDSGRLARTAENARDIERLGRVFAERYATFDRQKGINRACLLAFEQAQRFSREKNDAAARANLAYWRRTAPIYLRMRIALEQLAKNAGRFSRRMWS